ncbi:MAG: 5-carboxymethyl-2-hydroxymuconate Delta-isomerase [Pseudomonadota bacterium]
MPHFTYEYSANLDGRLDHTALGNRIFETAIATGFFEVGAVRVRAVRCDHYRVADALPDNAFLDLSLRMGQGRADADRAAIGEALFTALQDELADLLATPHFALSFEIREIRSAYSWKKNAIHPRVRAAEAARDATDDATDGDAS